MTLKDHLQRHLPTLFRPQRLKAAPLTSMVHDTRGGFGAFLSMLLPNTRYDFEKDIGNGLSSSVLAAPLNFLLRTFPEAPPIIERLTKDEWKVDGRNDLQRILKRPNDFYSGRTLGMCTALDLSFGEAFWLKIRNAAGDPVQLWWVPRTMVTPRWPNDRKTFIGHYDYSPNGGKPVELRPDDVVHFRFGLDPANPRRGLSPLGSLFREIGIDNEASNFTASILKNLGVIGVIISPDADGVTVPPGALDEIKAYIKGGWTGDKRGEPLALSRKTKVDLLQYQMHGFDVSPIRDVSEERVCAAMGIPAAVVGFGTGLHQTKVGATMKEMRQLAWTGGIIPMQDTIADQVDFSLLPDFDARATQEGTIRMRYDTTKVRALWEDNNEKHTRVREDYKGGVIDRAEARRETGRTVRPEDDGHYYSGAPTASPNPSPSPDPGKPALEEEDDEEDEEDPAP